jgi:MFS family permease/cytidylate kinase
MTTDEQHADTADDRYKWVALINTTLGVLVVTINSSIVIISLPAIFRGIGLNPLQPANVSYLLWILLGFLVVTSVLVVSFGRLGDSLGRVRLYNLGFAIFTACSIGLSLIFTQGGAAAMAIIVLRIVQGVGGAMIFANAAAILTDAFPANQRGMALGVNSVAAVAGSFIGLIIGGLLASSSWHLVFLVSVPIGLFGTIWGYARLREVSAASGSRMDWWGSALFAVGLVAVLVGLTYGIQPYGGHPMGWTNPAVLGSVIGGVLILGIFVLVERRVAEPMLDLALLRNRTFASGNLASLLSSIGRGGLLFALIIWLQGIWLPLRGYSFERTPLWSAIFMLPLTAGFLIAGPLAGIWSDRLGPRPFTIGGQLTGTVAFVLLAVLPVNFQYWAFALLLLAFGLGMGAFSSSNAAEVMGAVDPAQRGSAAGIRATALNCGQTLAISLFFSLLTAGLASRLPHALSSGLSGAGVPAPQAAAVAHLPPVAMLFATFLGYNPIQSLLGPALHSMPAATARTVTSTAFFPHVISGPFHDALQLTFGVAAALMLLATVACVLTRPRPVGAVALAPGTPRLGTRADATDALAAEAGRLEAQVRHWQQLAMAESAAVPLVVTVSAPLGAGGDQVAQRLAEQLKLPFVDRAIPAAVAEQLSVPVASARAHDERRESGALRLLVSAANTEPLFGLEVAAIDFDDEDQFRLATEASLWKLAATSGGVILGRVGAVILAGHPRAIHVRVAASRATRCRRVHEYGGFDQPAARRLIDRTDRARAEYARHLYGVDLNDPDLYDLIVATDKLSIDDAAEVVTSFLAVSGLQAPGTSPGRSIAARPG